VNIKNGILVVLFILFVSLLVILQRYTREYQVTLGQTQVPVKEVRAPRYIAQDFSLVDLGGEKKQLSDFRGSVVLILFWATW
jgi:cytochrome oxidase Cu insertion factor (SCO1/SenC/PrrC family)